MNYEEFLKTKQRAFVESGFDLPESAIFGPLFPFQSFVVRRALKAGKYAIFADCGLGKTIMQLEWALQVAFQTEKPVLILCPLAVSGQTISEGARFGYDVRKADMSQGLSNHGVYISNYEQLENLDLGSFGGVVLDESSILKNFNGETRNALIKGFKATPYKLCCTASPSPNDPMELGNHVEFLNVMSYKEMLSMYFVHDSSVTDKWRIKKHGVKAFYQFVSQWAIMFSNPAQIGFPMDGYVLPPLNILERQIKTPNRKGVSIFNDTAVSATDFNKELRLTKIERLSEVVEIVNGSKDIFIVWVNQNEEEKYLSDLIPDAKVVNGAMPPEKKESILLGFGRGEFRVLITKTKIAQFGLNYQNCHNQIFASLDFSFEKLYQAIRRSYRFGQQNAVNIYIITTDTMKNVIQSIKAKESQHIKMQSEMTDAINFEIMEQAPQIGTDSVKRFTSDWAKIYNGDAFELIKLIESDSIDGSVFSPPFSSLYTYSNSVADLSNCLSHDVFFTHFSFMIPELLRVTKSGRQVGIHLTQLMTGIAKDGYYSIIDFRGEIIRLFQKHGFLFHGEVTIWKSPELAAIRTKNHQLMHGTTKRDSTDVRPGLADYLVIFRKPGQNETPVNHDGNGIPFDEWCKIASPVWMDIDPSNTLQGWQRARENDDERHITPAQLGVIKNFLTMYTNKGETVLTPFMGIGSEVYQAIKMDRKAIGFELKESYFDLAVKNIQSIIDTKSQTSLF